MRKFYCNILPRLSEHTKNFLHVYLSLCLYFSFTFNLSLILYFAFFSLILTLVHLCEIPIFLYIWLKPFPDAICFSINFLLLTSFCMKNNISFSLWAWDRFMQSTQKEIMALHRRRLFPALIRGIKCQFVFRSWWWHFKGF